MHAQLAIPSGFSSSAPSDTHHKIPLTEFLASKPLSIVTVDDDDFDRRLIADCLGKHGSVTQVRSFTSGQEALRALFTDSQTPDLILLDISMPGMDGFEVLGRMGNVINDHQIPVVMVSSSCRGADIELALETLAAAYLVKPSSLSKLKGALDQVVTAVAQGRPLPSIINGSEKAKPLL